MFPLWTIRQKTDMDCVTLSDRHYSRQKPGTKQFMPPGQTVVLMTWQHDAVFGWWRPHPDSGVRTMHGLDAWTCTIFRNEGRYRSSRLIADAERILRNLHDVPRDGLITYVNRSAVKSSNPGYCFKTAGWRKIGTSADGKKDLLQKLTQ